MRICIVEKDLLISADIAETLKRVIPQAECSIFASVGEARAALTADTDPDVVLVSADRNGTIPGSDSDLAWVDGRRVIAVDFQKPGNHPAWIHLNKPFSEEELHEALNAAVMAGGQA